MTEIFLVEFLHKVVAIKKPANYFLHRMTDPERPTRLESKVNLNKFKHN